MIFRRSTILAFTSIIAISLPQPTRAQARDAAAARAEIDRLLGEADTSPAGATRGEALTLEGDRYEKIARLIEAFLKEHPDDSAADRFTIARINAIYWTVAARGHELDPIEEEVDRINLDKARPAVRVAVSYWKARLARNRLIRETVARGDDPPVLGPAAKMLEFNGPPERVLEEHARRHPDSATAASIAAKRTLLSLEQGDLDHAAQWIELLKKHHPSDALLDSLRGESKLREGVGQIWAPALKTVNNQSLDWGAMRGKVTLVVFWSPRYRPSATLLRRTMAFAAEHPTDTAIVAIGIDDDPAAARAALTELGFTGPQVHDGMGWRSPIAREYGIRVLPTALFLDREGRLVAIERLGRRQLSAEVVARLGRMVSNAGSESAETQPTEEDEGIPLPVSND